MKCYKDNERLSDEDSEISKDSCAGNKTKPEPINHRPVVFVLEGVDMSSQVLEDLIVSLK